MSALGCCSGWKDYLFKDCSVRTEEKKEDIFSKELAPDSSFTKHLYSLAYYSSSSLLDRKWKHSI